MRKLIWVFLLFPFFGIEAQENIRVNADPEAARYYFVLNNEGLSPYRNGRVAFFKNGKAYTAVLNEKLEKNDIKPAPELDGLGIEGRFTYDSSRNKIYFSKGGELYSAVITDGSSNNKLYNPRSGGYYSPVRRNGRRNTPQSVQFAGFKSKRETLYGSSIAYAGWRYKPGNMKIEGQRFSNPALSSDGKTLYYAAELESPETTGGLDIWYSTLEKDGTWSMPVNLGENVNTAFDESFPFIAGDTSIFFVSAVDVPTLLADDGNQTSNKQNIFFAPLNVNQKTPLTASRLVPAEMYGYGETEKMNNEQPVDKQSPVLVNVNDSIHKITEEEKPETKPGLATELTSLNEASSKIYIKDPKTCVFLFDYDNDQMIGTYHEEIDVLLKFLEHYKDSKYLIVGYTDERGSEEYNQVLSGKRAKKLYQILIEKGIPKEKMKYIGKGKNDPVVKGAQTEDEHQQNRRVEVRIED